MQVAATHKITFGEGTVTKRFRSWERNEPEREWRALVLLDAHRPGLAPRPLASGIDEDPPYVVMSYVEGTHLGADAPATVQQLDALAAALTTLHEAVPASELADLPERIWNPGAAVAELREWVEEGPGPGDDPLAAQALAAGSRWIASEEARGIGTKKFPEVLAQADGNLGNFLWDGNEIRLVDFEDSGRSDRAWEIADVAEHISLWVNDSVDVDALVDRFDLSANEQLRLTSCRRFFAMFWLLMLLPGEPAHRRNPEGTLHRQAERLLSRL